MTTQNHSDIIEIPDCYAKQIENCLTEKGAKFSVKYINGQAQFSFPTPNDTKAFIECVRQIKQSINASFNIT